MLVEAIIRVDPVVASSRVIASSPYSSLKGVNLVDLIVIPYYLD
jgi:hypothetical protein